MKVLILTAYHYPEQTASTYLTDNMYSAMVKSNIDILTYTPTPCRGIDKTLRNLYKSKKYSRELCLNGHSVVCRFPMYAEKGGAFRRALRYFFVGFKHFFAGISKEAKSCDVIFVNSTPPFQGALAALIQKINNKPIVYNLQDIFPDSLVGTGLAKKDGFLWKIGRVIENYTYRHADKIIVISEDFKRNIMTKGVPEDKIVVVYNWVDQDAVVNINRSDNKLISKYGIDPQKFYIEYSGNIGLTQNMDLLLDVMKDLKESHPDIGLILVGEGAYKTQVEAIVRRDNLTNVILLPFQDYADISHVFSLGDVGLVISKPGVGANSVPSKTWSIMSASRPVLANFDENEMKSILEHNKCGIFTKAGDKEAFKSAIIKLYNNREDSVTMGKNGRAFVMANLTREIGTQKYVDVIKSVVKHN